MKTAKHKLKALNYSNVIFNSTIIGNRIYDDTPYVRYAIYEFPASDYNVFVSNSAIGAVTAPIRVSGTHSYIRSSWNGTTWIP
jgi:hypothetical protein